MTTVRPEYLLLAASEEEIGARSAEHPAVDSLIEAGKIALSAELFGDDGSRLEQLLSAIDVTGEAAVRVVADCAKGPRVVVALRLPPRRRGPGAPSDAERFFAAGLRLGATAPAGLIRIDADSTLRHALWRGAALGAMQPGSAAAEGSWSSALQAQPQALPVFASGVCEKSEALRVAAVSWVRELTERAPNLLGPSEFADEILSLVEREGVDISAERWEVDDLVKRGFGATVGVGAASSRPPVVLRLTFGGGTSGGLLGLVGKGITFDSGGLNLKRDAHEISWMKADMAAAASVAAAAVLASRLFDDGATQGRERGFEVILPLSDNVVSGSAQRPGDVVRHPDGSSTEVVDTDCEGRLVLADGLAWLRTQGANALIDAGTLTDGGAGLSVSGLWANDDALAAAVQRAGKRALDPVWQIPLPYGEEASLESRVAHQKNAPLDRPDVGRHAALYLSRFAGDVPWAHLDVGGTAYLEEDHAGWPAGPTGQPTLVLAETIAAWLSGAV